MKGRIIDLTHQRTGVVYRKWDLYYVKWHNGIDQSWKTVKRKIKYEYCESRFCG